MRKRLFVGIAFVALLLGCFGTTVLDLNYGPWGDSGDVATALVSATGYIYTVGGAYDRFAIARIASATGALAPGTSPAPWGFGVYMIANPPPGPLGWVAFNPSTSSAHSANGVDLQGDVFYLTGVTGAGGAAGFGSVSLVDGSVLATNAFQVPDGLYGMIGDQPGEDIYVIGDHAYIFGAGAKGAPDDDVLWVAERTLTGSGTNGFGDLCPPTSACYPFRTGFSVLSIADSVTYGDTTLSSGDVAYSTVRYGDTDSEGRILVTTIDLPTGLLTELFDDGDDEVFYQPRAIALREDEEGAVERIIVAGVEGSLPNTSMFIIQYLPNGTRDSAFGTGGKVSLNLSSGVDEIRDIGLRADGTLVAVGVTGTNAIAARFLDDGSLDTTFSSTGYQTISTTGSVYNTVNVGQRVRAAGSVPGANGSRPNLLLSDLVDQP